MSGNGAIVTAARPSNPIAELAEPRMAQLEALFAGDAAKARRFVQQASGLAVRKPELGKLEKRSLWGSLISVAELGLDLTPQLGQAYIVPFKGTATLVIGYRGLTEIAYRSGLVRKIEAVLVRAGDSLDFERGTSPRITHKEAPFGKRGEITGAYAIATLSNGEQVFELMERSEIDGIRKRSNARSGPWDSDFGEMAKKTVTRRLTKYLPTTPLLARALELDGDKIDTGEPVPDGPARSRLADAIDETPEEPPFAPAEHGRGADDEPESREPEGGFVPAAGVKIGADDIPF